MVFIGSRQVDSPKIDCTDQTDKIVAVILKAISILAIVNTPFGRVAEKKLRSLPPTAGCGDRSV